MMSVHTIIVKVLFLMKEHKKVFIVVRLVLYFTLTFSVEKRETRTCYF